MLRTDEGAQQPFTFRIIPGNVKTIGRAPRADFIVDAALVSRLHCRLVGRPGRLKSLEQFVMHVRRKKVWIARRIDIARHWLKNHPYG